MQFSDPVWWVAMLLPTFCVFYLAAMILRNHAAKKDTLEKTKADLLQGSVAIKPRKHTRKLD